MTGALGAELWEGSAMGVSYEWHAATGTPAFVEDAAALRDMTDSADDISDATIGVGFDDGGGGAVVYGEPADVLRFLSDAVARVAELVARRAES